MTLPDIVGVLHNNRTFLLVTHEDPDADGIGSMLALGRALGNAGKSVVLFSERPLSHPLNALRGSETIVHTIEPEINLETLIVLDCGHPDRIGAPGMCLETAGTVINIDHHRTDHFFGDFNLVDPESSSTGELVYRLVSEGRFPMDKDVAENIFAAIQSDTGFFRYGNTTSESFKIAAELMTRGVNPWEISLKMSSKYSLSQIELLRMALESIEFHCDGRVGMVTLTCEMYQKAGAGWEDSERFVDYLRFVSGVELAVLIREAENHRYKISLRSNNNLNAAELAALFGGGGHVQAAGFDWYESIESMKNRFLSAAGRFLGDPSI